MRISRIYASNYLTLLHGRLKQQYKREPTPGELYAAYNMGMSSFRKCNYDLNQVNPVTSAKCKQLNALILNKSDTVSRCQECHQQISG